MRHKFVKILIVVAVGGDLKAAFFSSLFIFSIILKNVLQWQTLLL